MHRSSLYGETLFIEKVLKIFLLIYEWQKNQDMSSHLEIVIFLS